VGARLAEVILKKSISPCANPVTFWKYVALWELRYDPNVMNDSTRGVAAFLSGCDFLGISQAPEGVEHAPL